MKLDRLTLEVKRTQFLGTLEGKTKDEYYGTDRDIFGNVISQFIAWLYAAEDAKAERHRQYEELRKEFEPTMTGEAPAAPPPADVFAKYFDFEPYKGTRNNAEKIVASLMPTVENPPSADCMAVGHMMRDWLEAAVADAGTKIDTGGGLGGYDLWVKVGGKELFITIKESDQKTGAKNEK